MNRILTCPVCGKEFATNKNAAKYCSASCRRKANAPCVQDSERTFICQWCGEDLCQNARKNIAATNVVFIHTENLILKRKAFPLPSRLVRLLF